MRFSQRESALNDVMYFLLEKAVAYSCVDWRSSDERHLANNARLTEGVLCVTSV